MPQTDAILITTEPRANLSIAPIVNAANPQQLCARSAVRTIGHQADANTATLPATTFEIQLNPFGKGQQQRTCTCCCVVPRLYPSVLVNAAHLYASQ